MDSAGHSDHLTLSSFEYCAATIAAKSKRKGRVMNNKRLRYLFPAIILCVMLTACRGDSSENTSPTATTTPDLSSVPTEMVDSATFCSDQRPLEILEAVKGAVRNRDGQALANLVSPDGLYMSLFPSADPVHLTIIDVELFFEDDTMRNWGNNVNSGEPIEASLAGRVTTLLQEDLLADNIILACNNNQDTLSTGTTLYSIDHPVDNFYSAMRPGAPGSELSWGAWGLGFEYRQGQPLLTVLTHYIWTP